MDRRLNPHSSRRYVAGDRIFLDDYQHELMANTVELYNATGDFVYLLKKQKSPRNTPNVSGIPGKMGNRGSNRVSIATGAQPTQTSYARPEEKDEEALPMAIPASVEAMQVTTSKVPGGRQFNGNILVHVASKWLKDRDITVDVAEDSFMYDSHTYKIVGQPPFAGALKIKHVVSFECAPE